MSEWISVEDRWPSDGELVIVDLYGDSTIAWYSSKTGSFLSEPKGLSIGSVRHWMPLPEPPK